MLVPPQDSSPKLLNYCCFEGRQGLGEGRASSLSVVTLGQLNCYLSYHHPTIKVAMKISQIRDHAQRAGPGPGPPSSGCRGSPPLPGKKPAEQPDPDSLCPGGSWHPGPHSGQRRQAHLCNAAVPAMNLHTGGDPTTWAPASASGTRLQRIIWACCPASRVGMVTAGAYA